MALSEKTLSKLSQPLDPSRVRHREGGGGRSLSYLEGHDVIRVANDIFGIGGWGYTLGKLINLGTEDVTVTRNGQTKKGVRVAYTAEVFVRVGDTEYGDVGYGDAVEYTGSILTPHELAAKEAVTDALKRALKNLGDQFGLCLYDKFAPEHDGRARSGGVPSPAAGKLSAPGDPSSPGAADGKGAAAGSVAAPTEKQIAYLRRLMADKGVTDLGKPIDQLTKQECSKFIEQLKDGSFNEASVEQELIAAGATPYDDTDIPFDKTVDGLGN